MRRADWRTQLHAWAEVMIGSPFAWGQTDCASMARGALDAMFGRDVVAFLPRWTSASEALEALTMHGPIEAIFERLGAERSSLPFLRAGDVIIDREPREAVGHVALFVCLDGRRCITSGPDGIALVDDVARVAFEPVVYSLWEVARGQG